MHPGTLRQPCPQPNTSNSRHHTACRLHRTSVQSKQLLPRARCWLSQSNPVTIKDPSSSLQQVAPAATCQSHNLQHHQPLASLPLHVSNHPQASVGCMGSQQATMQPQTLSPSSMDGHGQTGEMTAAPQQQLFSSMDASSRTAEAAAVPQQEVSSTGPPGTLNRRGILAATLITAGQLAAEVTTQPAHALKTITMRDGSQVEVYEHGMMLNIVALKGTVPQDWIMNFKSTLGRYGGFTLGQRNQIQDIYKELSDPPGTKNSASVADVISLSDAWLGPAIRAGLLQPIPNAQASRWFQRLSPRWQALVRRDSNGHPDPHGQVYACPYRWGSTLIAYRKEWLTSRGGRPITDWCDLLQPQLRGKVAMTESSREFMGAALKAAHPLHSLPLNHSSSSHKSARSAPSLGFNATAAALTAQGIGAEELTAAARALRDQVLLFSNNDHVRAFAAGDAHAIVGWSQEIITLAERSSSVEAVVPYSGTALFADLWAVPAGAQGGHMQTGPSPLLPAWLEYSVMPARSASLLNIKSGASPAVLDQYHPREPIPDGQHEGVVINYDNGYLPSSRGCLERSEFLMPLDAATKELYGQALRGLSVRT